MPCIGAAGAAGTRLFVFKGLQLPYREFKVDGKVHIETLSSCLPRGALVFMRQESGTVYGN